MKSRLVDFLEPLKHFIVHLGLDNSFEAQLKQLERKFVIISILFHKYKKLFGELFYYDPTTESIEQNKKEKFPVEVNILTMK